MIEQALYEHLIAQDALAPCLARYNDRPAVFSQNAPADADSRWGLGPQYPRLVFAEDLSGDPSRILGGLLAVDILCEESGPFPEDLEPLVRALIHGWFFSNGSFTVAAQWKNSAPFTEPQNHIAGCTLSFDLLAFPMLTTANPDVTARMNEWTHEHFDGLHVLNYDTLSASAWRPDDGDSAIYWRVSSDEAAGWIPDTHATIWRTARLKAHLFAKDSAAVLQLAVGISTTLYAVRRLTKPGESPIMTNRRNSIDAGADPLRTGQLSVEATYGVIVRCANENTFQHIHYR